MLIVIGVVVAILMGTIPGLANWTGLSGALHGLLAAVPILNGWDAKFWGVVVMGGAVIVLFFLPWLDKSPVRSGHFRPTFRKFYYLLVVDMLVLGYCGGSPAEIWRSFMASSLPRLKVQPIPGGAAPPPPANVDPIGDILNKAGAGDGETPPGPAATSPGTPPPKEAPSSLSGLY